MVGMNSQKLNKNMYRSVGKFILGLPIWRQLQPNFLKNVSLFHELGSFH